MPIQSGDVKLLKSAVMADVPEGGGAPTGLVVADGVSNAIFPDISELDRAGGRVNLRKSFVQVATDGTVVTAAGNESEPWFDAENVRPDGKIFRPEPVAASSLRYSAVAYSYLPLDAALLGIDPVRLPSDGRVPIFRPGGFAVVGHTGRITASVSNGQANSPVVTALRVRQRSWAQGLGLWLEIQGEGRLSAVHQAAIAERFEAAGHRAPQLRYASAHGGHQATWLATWHWDEAVWVPKDMPVADVKRWALETALKATEHWLLMCGMVALAGKPQGAALALGTGLVGVDVKREATNEKKF